MSTKRWVGSGLAVAVAVAVVLGLAQADRSHEAPGLDLASQLEGVAGAPAPLADVYAQANTLLPGGIAAIDRRVRALRGRPIVVNVWASWCPPCRAEIPAFQRVAARHGRDVAFLGVNSDDKQPAATSFLSRRPLVYPSYLDPDGRFATRLHLTGLPATIMYDNRGQLVTLHQGPYESAEDLARDVEGL